MDSHQFLAVSSPSASSAGGRPGAGGAGGPVVDHHVGSITAPGGQVAGSRTRGRLRSAGADAGAPPLLGVGDGLECRTIIVFESVPHAQRGWGTHAGTPRLSRAGDGLECHTMG